MLQPKLKDITIVLLLMTWLGVITVGYFADMYLTRLEDNRNLSINHPFAVRTALMDVLHSSASHGLVEKEGSEEDIKIDKKIEEDLLIIEEKYLGDKNEVRELRNLLRENSYKLSVVELELINKIRDFSSKKISDLLEVFTVDVSQYRVSIIIICFFILLLNTTLILVIYNFSKKAYISEAKSRELVDIAASVFDSSKEAFMVVDDKHRVILTNSSFERITGYMSNHVIGENIEAFTCLGGVRNFKDIWNSCLDKDTWKGEIISYKKSGEPYYKHLSIDKVITRSSDKGEADLPKYVIKFFDISDRVKLEAEVLYMAQYDGLTGIPNRRFLSSFIQNLTSNKSNELNRFALVFIDLDNFKYINDFYGHAEGDSILKQVAQRLRASVRSTDLVSRYGGDEFIVILRYMDDISIEPVVHKIYKELTTLKYPINGNSIDLKVSLGVSNFPHDGLTEEAITHKADSAMYQVKKDGGSGVLFWTNCHSDSTSAQIEKELINSIKSNNFSRFFLVYQPQIEIKTNKVIGCEALLRWVFNGEVISPAIFIPILENSDAIIEVGTFVLGKACEDFKEFQDLLVCVNISLRQINHTDFVNHVIDTVDLFKFPYVYLELEITESVFTDDFKKTCAPLLHLKEMGLKISIDDFGVGYSSLSRLIHLPIDKLKIDGSFMAGLEDNDSARKMVKSVVQIGKTLNLKVIAEGVETKEQVEFLLDIDCDQVQGYYYAKPMKLDDFRVWLAAWTSKYPENKNV